MKNVQSSETIWQMFHYIQESARHMRTGLYRGLEHRTTLHSRALLMDVDQHIENHLYSLKFSILYETRHITRENIFRE